MKQSPYLYRFFTWNISKLFTASLWLKYRFKCKTKLPIFPKAPFVTLSNHGTFFDPWIIGWYTFRPFSYMMNDDGFRGPPSISTRYLKSIDCIPKKKGTTDYKAMKTTIQFLKNGASVCVFPEGQTTWDGETQPVFPGIEKIVKKVNCGLVLFKIQGDFLTKPWWAKSTRNGRVLITAKQMSPEEIAKYTSEEILQIYKDYIYQNDIKDPENLAYPFKGKRLAEGLERFVWICMDCGCEDTLITENNTITCTSCGKSWNIDAHCRLSANTENTTSLHDLKDWSDMLKQKVKEKIKSNPQILTQSPNVIMQTENDKFVFENADKGTLILTPTELTFKSDSTSYSWPVEKLSNYVIQKKDIFEFNYEDKLFRFVFDKKSVMKWVFYVRYLKDFETIESRGYY